MLSLFKGEMLFHPAALDYSGNTCSNNCAYCFANIRANRREFQIRKLSNLCLGKAKGETLMDWFFYQGYPVCISNRSDPFAASNRDNTPVALELMNLVPNGLYIQTKGLAHGWSYSDLDKIQKKNVIMYITVDTLRDDICKRIEPGAPLPESRLELARYAKSRGWFVTIGMTPLWEPWMPQGDFGRALQAFDEIGVDVVFMQSLHLPRRSIEEMSPDKMRRMGDDIKDVNAKREDYAVRLYHRCWDDKTIWEKFRHKFTLNEDPFPTQAFSRERKFLGKALPVWSDFNCAAEAAAWKGNKILRFADYVAALTADNPELLTHEDKSFNAYIASMEMMLWKKHALCKNAKSFVDLLRCYWRFGALWLSPRRNPFILPIVDRDGKEMVDEFGDPIYYYSRLDEAAPESGPGKIRIDELEGKGVNLP